MPRSIPCRGSEGNGCIAYQLYHTSYVPDTPVPGINEYDYPAVPEVVRMYATLRTAVPVRQYLVPGMFL